MQMCEFGHLQAEGVDAGNTRLTATFEAKANEHVRTRRQRFS